MRDMILLMASSMLFNTIAVDEMNNNVPVDFVIETNDVSGVGIASGDEISEILTTYGLEEEETFSWSCSYENGAVISLDNADDVVTPEMVEAALTDYTSDYDFVTSNGRLVNVGTGTLGIKPEVDYELEAAQLNAFKVSGVNLESRVPSMKDETLGKTYVEVSLDEQYMWVYKDGVKAFETPVTTGDILENRGTPRGAYYVYFTDTNRWLRGSYEGAWFVECWMRITQDGIGLHDASWRNPEDFGGDNYKTGNGSHGCINIPTEYAHALFDMCYHGLPVVIY